VPILGRTKPNACSNWRVYAPGKALPLRKVMQLIGFASALQQDILSISIWSSTQSRGTIFPSKRNKTAGKR
jgi:hypothetical protein